MTISQPSSNDRPACIAPALRPFWAAILARFLHLSLGRWRERRRAKADLIRLAEAGDYLLLDVGLDPALTRQNPGAVLDQIARIKD